jgi:hypothetical protein
MNSKNETIRYGVDVKKLFLFVTDKEAKEAKMFALVQPFSLI